MVAAASALFEPVPIPRTRLIGRETERAIARSFHRPLLAPGAGCSPPDPDRTGWRRQDAPLRGHSFAGPQAVVLVRKSKHTGLEAAAAARHRDLSGAE